MLREEPRPYGERFKESSSVPLGHIVRLCQCGNSFAKKPEDTQRYCSKLCIRRYADIKSNAFQALVDNKKTAE